MIYLIKITISLFLLLPTLTWADHHIPNEEELKTGEDYATDIRAFLKWDGHTLLTEYRFRNNRFGDDQKDVSLGYRFRLHDNIKIGLVGRRSYGLIHDEDWTDSDNLGWRWRKTSERGEDQIMPELTFRGAFDRFVAELRLRHIWNMEMHEQTEYARTSLTYFIFSKGRPLLNISLRYEWFFPSNYSEKEINEQWIYLDTLYHINKTIKMGLFFAIGEQIWTETQDFRDLKNDKYTFIDKSRILGWTLNLYF